MVRGVEGEEHVKLDYEDLERLLAESAEEATRTRVENAKLGGLVSELWTLAYGYVPFGSELDGARDMMRGLGIEVDG